MTTENIEQELTTAKRTIKEIDTRWRDAAAERDEHVCKLDEICTIIESVDNRCMDVDGPVTPTLQEMTQEEISRIYELAKSVRE